MEISKNHKDIIENEYHHLMEHSCTCRHLFDNECNRKQGILKADNGTVDFISNGMIYFIAYFSPDELSISKIECNRLAKEFVNIFTVEQLQQDYIKSCEKKEKERIEAERIRKIHINFFKNRLLELKNILPIGEFQLNEYNGILKWEYKNESLNSRYPYTTERWFFIEIEMLSENKFIVAPTFFFGRGGSCSNEFRFECDYIELITYLKKTFNERLNPSIEIAEAERKKIDDEISKRFNLEGKLRKLCNGNVVIIKTGKNSYVCFNGFVEWTISKQSKGKIRRFNFYKMIDRIMSKGLTDYLLTNREEDYSLEDLSQIKFSQL